MYSVFTKPVVSIFGRFASVSGFTSSLFYAFFSRSFDREHQAVLAGKRAFGNVVKTNASSSPELRRNIHRLEKGLTMKPRRPFFAEDYIGRTVQLFIDLASSENAGFDELKWADDVLESYFSTVTSTEKISDAAVGWRNSRSVLIDNASKSSRHFSPYFSEKRKRANIQLESFADLVRERRSVRWYMDTVVEQCDLDKAISAASMAASACNRQPYSFLTFTDRDLATNIAKLAGGTAGWCHQIPALIVVIGDLSCFPHERDRHLPYIDASLATSQMLLALQCIGISSCVINWPDIEENDSQIHERLALEVHERVIMLVAVGYADPKGLIPWSHKKLTSQLKRFKN